MEKFIIVVLCLGLFGCSLDPVGLDGDYVQGSDGNIYEVESAAGDTYFIREVDTNQIEQFNKLQNK